MSNQGGTEQWNHIKPGQAQRFGEMSVAAVRPQPSIWGRVAALEPGAWDEREIACMLRLNAHPHEGAYASRLSKIRELSKCMCYMDVLDTPRECSVRHGQQQRPPVHNTRYFSAPRWVTQFGHAARADAGKKLHHASVIV